MLKQILKRLFCKHRNKIATVEDWNLFGSEHKTYICTDCGKKFW